MRWHFLQFYSNIMAEFIILFENISLNCCTYIKYVFLLSKYSNLVIYFHACVFYFVASKASVFLSNMQHYKLKAMSMRCVELPFCYLWRDSFLIIIRLNKYAEL